MSELEPMEIDSFEDTVIYELLDVINNGNPENFIHFYKSQETGQYDRIHVLHTLSDLPVKTLENILENNLKLQLLFCQFEEVFDEQQALNKDDSLQDHCCYMTPAIH